MKTAIKPIGRFFLLFLLTMSGLARPIYAGQGLGGEQKSLEDEKQAEFKKLTKYYERLLKGKSEIHLPGTVIFEDNIDLNTQLLRQLMEDYNVEALADALISNNSLTKLILMSRLLVTDEAAKYLGDALEFNDTLKEISIHHSQITGKGAALLFSSKHLERIDLRLNQIAGGEEISKALLGNNTLKSLDLSFNPLNKDDLEKIINTAKNKDNLIDLYFRGTASVGTQSIQALFSMPKLISLSIHIDPEEPGVIAALVSALKNDTKLLGLSICMPRNSKLSDADFYSIYNVLKINYVLIKFSLVMADYNTRYKSFNILSKKKLNIIRGLEKRNKSFKGRMYVWNKIKYFAPALLGMGNSNFENLVPEVKKQIIFDLVDTMKYLYFMDIKKSAYFECRF